jgi:hypothetical protein
MGIKLTRKQLFDAMSQDSILALEPIEILDDETLDQVFDHLEKTDWDSNFSFGGNDE